MDEKGMINKVNHCLRFKKSNLPKAYKVPNQSKFLDHQIKDLAVKHKSYIQDTPDL